MSQQDLPPAADQPQATTHDHHARPKPRRRGLFARLGERAAQFAYIGVWASLFILAGFVSAGATFVPFFDRDDPIPPPAEPVYPPAPERITEGGLKLPAKVIGNYVQPAMADGTFLSTPMFWAGVNLGSSVPGEDPGATAATRPDFDRWLNEMGELGVTSVRVYTILGPAFYDALRAYNLTHPDRPIYVLHGVWIPEEDHFYEVDNIWDPVVTSAQEKEIRDVVAVVHGDAVIEKLPGHASGIYRSDISPWLMGWSFGIEWDPEATYASDKHNKGMKPFQGKYFKAKQGASPMESWIARKMNLMAELQAARGWSVPMTFTNWDTTDALAHPVEPLHVEDLVTIDATNIEVTSAWPAGYFASFHAYPYYPDFNRWQPEYLNYVRKATGLKDPYAGYINDLVQYHRKRGLAVMITEFGQPTSLGCAHYAPLGRHQGCHSEQEAAANVVDMMRILKEEGVAGGMVFMWLDEWFKFTWNTINYELPGDHRRLWRSPFTNEEHFGIIAAEPGPSDLVVLDGDEKEWAEDGEPLGTGTDSVKLVSAVSDAENVYLRIRVTPELWTRKQITIGLDGRPGGNGGLPGQAGVDTNAEMAVVIEPGVTPTARMYHAGWIEPLCIRYGGSNPAKTFLPPSDPCRNPATWAFESGKWIPIRQILNYSYALYQGAGEFKDAEFRDASNLPWGTTDPASPAFDDRNLLMGKDGVLEVALPWGLMSFADPSNHSLYVVKPNPDDKETVSTRKIDKLGISIKVEGEPLVRTKGYTWEGWDSVQWHERRKAGWPILRREYQSHLGPFASSD